jgi:hypothetical protein
LHPNYSRDVSNPFEKISVLEKNNKNNCQNQFFPPSALFPIFKKKQQKFHFHSKSGDALGSQRINVLE